MGLRGDPRFFGRGFKTKGIEKIAQMDVDDDD
jgi:hypothetical protein